MRIGKRIFAILTSVAGGLSLLFSIGCFVSMVDGTYSGELVERKYFYVDDPVLYLLEANRQAANNIYYFVEMLFLVAGLAFAIAAVVLYAVSIKSFLELRSMPKENSTAKELKKLYKLYENGYITKEEYIRNKNNIMGI